MAKKLFKSDKNKMICGVCGGIAEYFNIDVTLIRIIAVLLCLFSVGTGVVVYIIIAFIMPGRDKYDDNENIDNLKSANTDSYESKSETNSSSPHSDEEFNSHFKK